MPDDGFVAGRDRHPLHRNVEILRSGEKHLAGFPVAVVLARRARKRMARDAVVAVGFQKRFSGAGGVAGALGAEGFFLPARAQRIPRRRPDLAREARHLRQRFLGFGRVGVQKRRAAPDPLADVVFDFFEGARLAHGFAGAFCGLRNVEKRSASFRLNLSIASCQPAPGAPFLARRKRPISPCHAVYSYPLYKTFFAGVDFFSCVTEQAMAAIIDGKAVAREGQRQIKEEVEGLERRWGLAPGLAVILVGDDPASHIYVRNKEKACREVGIRSFEHLLPATISEKELLALVHQLNKDKDVHGILVQLPLPPHIHPEKILEAVSPRKDIDGFHPMSQGMLLLGGDGFRPCTPLGIMKLLASVDCDPKGKNATVTICHSRTASLRDEVARADILVVAIGKAGLVRGEWVKPGAVVIDV